MGVMMLPFLATWFFLLLLGKKVLIPNMSLLCLSLVLAFSHFVFSLNTIGVLILLFVASPLLIRFRYSVLTPLAFWLCVLLPILTVYSI